MDFRNRYMTIITALILLLPFTDALGQSGVGARFLLIAPGARAGGMGEAQVAVANDAYATYWNPAGLGFQDGTELAAMHMQWLPGLVDDIYYEFMSMRHTINSIGSFGIQGTYLNLGEMTQTGPDSPKPLNTFSSYMWNIGISYSKEVASGLSAGVTVKYFRQFLAPASVMSAETDAVSNSYAIDIGILYRQLWSGRLSLGMVLANIGPSISFYDQEQADPAPTRLLTGISLGVLREQNISLDVAYDLSTELVSRDSYGHVLPFYKGMVGKSPGNTYLSGENMSHNFGSELWLYNTLALRAGGFYDNSGMFDSNSFIPTLGAGVRFGSFGFDMSYLVSNKKHPMANTMRFSVSMEFE